MNKRLKASAVIVAAGKGSRMQMDINKQYVDICGKPVLARTLEVFDRCSIVDSIVVVVNESDIIFCKQNIVDYYEISKISAIVSGGLTRQESVYKGLLAVGRDTEVVAVHDGARPLITEEVIENTIYTALATGASCTAVPVKDTIKAADEEGNVAKTFDRSLLWSIQTPQTFKYVLLMEAYKKAIEESFTGTDDATLVERLGYKIKLVTGNYENIKITTKEDLIIAEAFIRASKK